MLDFLVVLSTFGIAGMLVALVVAAVQQKQKRVFAVGLAVFVLVFVVCISIYPREADDEVPPNGDIYSEYVE